MADTMNAAATHASTFRLTAEEAQAANMLNPDSDSGNWHVSNLPARFGYNRATLYPDLILRTKNGAVVRDSNDKVKRFDSQDGKILYKVQGVKGVTPMTRQELMNKQLTDTINTIIESLPEGQKFEIHMLLDRLVFTELQRETGERWLKASISAKVAVKADQLLGMLGINS
jgi:hypothetical protein